MKQNKLFCILTLLLPSLVLFGNFSVLNIRIAGLVITSYRLFIPAIFLVMLYYQKSQNQNRRLLQELSFYEKYLYCVMGTWIVYGIATIMLFPYAKFHDGALEILSLLLGTLTVCCIVMLLRHDTWDYLMKGIKIAVIITIIIGLYEIFTADHLSTSYYSDPELLRLNREIFGPEADKIKWHVATSVFYNENDYSAMLAVFAPFFITGKDPYRRIEKTADIISLCAVFFILFCNNAFICFIALMIGCLIALGFGVNGIRNRIIIIASLLFTRLVVVELWEKYLGDNLGLETTLSAQLANNQLGQGSMFYRINTYKTTIQETLFTSKGMGFGAGSFTNYFSKFADSHKIMVNPHCFWFEILSEYGIVVFLLFISFLVILMIALIRNAYTNKDNRSIAVIASGTALIFACVAPSSFLKAGYYWIPIAMAVFIAGYNSEERVEEGLS